jgi:triosephosphate isomerase
MTHKKTLIVGNWKMHNDVSRSSVLAARLQKHIHAHRDIEVVLAPTMLALQPLSVQIDRRKFRLAAQNAYPKDEGGFTGEISIAMLRDLVHYVIIGHSERRIHFGESLDLIRDKVAACVRNGITPILCVGETQHERRNGETKQVLHDQVSTALSDLTAEDVGKIVIAYEPIWAISTFDGELAKPGEVQDRIEFIRKQIEDLYGSDAANGARILYGGSVNEHIVRGYLEIPGCDGALVGAASLNYHKFAAIVESAYRLNRDKESA